MKVYLERKGYSYSAVTVHKYMNTELDLRSIVRPKKPGYEHGKPHKVFDNQLNQNFTADEINRNGARILPICSLRIMKYAITVPL